MHFLFPARLTYPGGTRREGFVGLVTEGSIDRVYAWEGGMVAIAEAPTDEVVGSGSSFTLPDGSIVTKAGGCGCGSPLKRALRDLKRASLRAGV